MAQKKKKGPAPRKNETPKRHMSTSQMVFAVVGVLIVLSMLISMFRFY